MEFGLVGGLVEGADVGPSDGVCEVVEVGEFEGSVLGFAGVAEGFAVPMGLSGASLVTLKIISACETMFPFSGCAGDKG